EGVPEEACTFRLVEYMPSLLPAYPGTADKGYLRTDKGLYPDLLRPLGRDGVALMDCPKSVWVDVLPQYLQDGEQELKVSVLSLEENEVLKTHFLRVTRLPFDLPEQTLTVTEWLHTDSIVSYYRIPVHSEEYWRITENFMKTAVKNGINTILTPVLTPPLDTEVGGERICVQLTDIAFDGEIYTFGFEKLDRWVALCRKVGFTHFEISHLFTQWGAEHAPNIYAQTREGYKRIFGWETDAAGEEYRGFLKQFLPALTTHLKELGIFDKCFFHISDEPNETHEESYRKAQEGALPYLEGAYVMDALSEVKYYQNGVIKHPIPSSNNVDAFLKENIEDRWVYYCCGQTVNVSNRFFAMPGARTRFMGWQMYRHGIKGFLQWGYNFYFSRFAREPVNPFADSTGNGFTPSGDCYSVYPAPDGTAWESMRICQFRQGIDDMRALTLAETLLGKDEVSAFLQKHYGEIRFDKCICSSQKLLTLRKELDRLILSAKPDERKAL
ncbi:MAG: DUF4091 domain-containing protein, partial [Clostridia bacterium]|nr:DUF4091 domain-containing protein [Clostridia bacterium]